MASNLTFWVKNLTYWDCGITNINNIELKWVLNNDIEDLDNIIGFVTGIWTDELESEIYDQLKEKYDIDVCFDHLHKYYTMQSLFQRDFVYDHLVKLEKGVYEIKWST